MACMYSRGYTRDGRDDRIEELENRIKELEEKMEKIITMKKPSFMDFHFINNEEEKKKKLEEERRVMASRMRAMFSR